MDSELEALKWGAGSRLSLEPFNSIDSDALLRLVAVHRITGRMLRRLQRDPQRWADDEMVSKLASMQSADEEGVGRQIEVFRELHDAYSSSCRIVMPIKGFASHLLLGDQATMRPAGDIDIACSSQEHLIEALAALGFTRHDAEAVSLHLFSPKLYRDDMVIDAYDFVPVWKYPQKTNLTAHTTEHGAVVFNPKILPKYGRIYFPDLIRHTVQYPTPESRPFVIPNHTMMAFLLCTHIFRDFFQALPHPTIPLLKLGTLADLYDLARHPSFVREAFVKLIEQFDGEDCVLFAGKLLEAYFGQNPLPSLSTRYEHTRLWQLYYLYTYWLPAPYSSNDLLACPDPTRPLSDLVDLLRGSIVRAGVSTNERKLTVFGQGGQTVRALVNNVEDRRLPVDFSLRWLSEGLVLDLRVEKERNFEPDIVLLEFGEFICLWQHNSRTRKEHYYGKGSRVEFNCEDGGYNLCIVVPWSDFEHWGPEQESIAMLLAVFSLEPDQLGRPILSRTKSSTLVPLRIVRD